MQESFNLDRVLQEYKTYGQRQYTAGENGIAAREQRDIQNAKKAIESEQGFLNLTLKEKVKDLLIPGRVVEEFRDVAVKTLMSSVEPFLNWLEENEVYYTENLFNEEIRANAKQLHYTKWALSNEAASGDIGQQFYASF